MKAYRFPKTLCSLILISVACLLPANVFGQTAATARISGLVTDANGAAVPGSTVKLLDKTTKAEKTTTTNDEGRYAFANIDPGTYDITITLQGFRTAVFSDVKADIANATIRDAALEAGNVSETVTVSATGDVLLKTDDATVGNTIEQLRLERLPITNRQATQLLILQPGVSPGGEVAGSRADQNTYSLDGLDVSDQVGFRGSVGTVVPIPSESVEEFRVTVANPNATFGRSGGAQVTLVTKRGGNDFHGSVYAYHQNDNLNANTWNNNRLGLRRAEAKDNRFGTSVGGPIWKDHTFFFFNYEGRRVPGSQQVTRIVPTQSFRDGLLKFRDASGVVNTFDPRTFDPRGLGSNPGILSYLKKLPLPNDLTLGDGGLNTGGFIANIPTTLRDDFGVLRLDHKINSNWSVEARTSLYRLIQLQAGQVNIVDLKPGAAITERPKNFTVGVTGTLRSNLVNEFRVGHAYDNFVLGVIDPSTIAGFNVAADVSGIDEAIDVDTQRARRQSLGGGTTQYVDNATWTKGTHTFQFGGTLRAIKTYHLRNDKVIGSLSTPVAAIGNFGSLVVGDSQRPTACSATVTINCLRPADAARYNALFTSLLGIVDNVSFLATRDANLGPNPPGTPLINNAALRHWEFYVADTWRMKPSLTFSYGVQYQWHTPPKDELDRQTLLAYRSSLELIDPRDYLRQKREAAEKGEIFNPDIAYVPVKAAGKDVFKINRKNFSPRLSLAWQPSFNDGLLESALGERRTVFRFGYGRLYDRLNTVSSVVVPMLGVGFAQTLNFRAPLNGAGQPFRVGIDGPIPVPVNTAVTSPVVPAKGFGELLSFTLDPNIKDPYNHAIDFTVQRELPANMAIEVGYLGRYARNLFQNLNLNSAPYFFKDKASGQRFSEAFDAVAGQLRTGVAASAVTPQPWFRESDSGTRRRGYQVPCGEPGS
ncbi:MAG: carboxypeptidase regulatory-like domain-containing protein [Pyrinomonadaceae bacterium]